MTKERVRLDKNIQAFFELLRAGLWEEEARLAPYGEVDYSEILKLATEQSVVGLVAASLEHVKDVKVPQQWVLQFISQMLQIEQRNKAMNVFVAELMERLRKADIYAILVKGQGIAQCYEKPLWRSSGDVDLLLSDSNYEKAKTLLVPLATAVETEFTHFKHLGMTINGWVVELHGTLHSRLSARVDCLVDEVQREVFYGGKVRSWMNGKTTVFLPAPDEDVIFVFTHILHHFFFEGIGLRQICDWCRLLYTYKDSLNYGLLESRIRKAGLMTEWKVFYNLASRYLGMPDLDSSFKFHDSRFDKKAGRICKFVLEVGNFGQNTRRNFAGQSYLVRKFNSFWGRLSDMLRHFRIFPLDSIRFFGGVLRSGLHAAVRGE